ncbi:hypothetical protein [Yersinia frederiksenii]|uniref:Uncharacterized protein n=1 Tax=Yersinia frederiksenii TaxID=29484 RepID=A0AAI8ZQ03_YERFR|nr:hypothetical protein [Yersinia frederiksenii]CFQ95875.1 Uncharacterised protein [Yersinia frederiksenii]
MDITKSQSDFDAWIRPQLFDDEDLCMDCGLYLNYLVRISWDAWQSSRSKLQVIPASPKYDFSGKTTDYRDGFVHGGYKRDENWHTALRTAGIRIKGESE